ncbi:MAG: alpha/beta hydrolase [Parachlamydiales bacterium]|nr:alpha/beta hydrolase [Parachlamydiales bacterium]
MVKNIVIVHGWGATTKKLQPLERELKNTGWNTLLLKLPGFDLPSPDHEWYLDDYIIFIVGKAKENFKKKKFFLFGHSFGGRVGIKTAKDPHLGTLLNGLILCSAGGVSRGKIIKRIFFIVVSKIGKVLMLFPKSAKIFKKFVYKAAGEHDYEKTEGVMRGTFRNIIKEEIKNDLEKINTPVLILWGKDDKVTPVKDAYYLNKNIKNSKLKLYSGRTHNLPYVEYKNIAKDINNWFSNLN